jgi:hypothetical protein
MVVGDLVDYLKEHIALGYDINELKLQLVRYGHSAKNVEEALEILRKDALNGLPQPPLPQGSSVAAHTWLLMPAILFVLLFSIGMIVYVLRNTAL